MARKLGLRVTWIDRTLLLGPQVAAVTSQRAYRALVRQLGVSRPEEWCSPAWFACVHAFEVDGALVCVVALNLERLAALDPIDQAATIVHEAVHVWQLVRDRLGPGDLGREMEAYAVQNISAGLMRAFAAATSSSVSPG